ncbi:L,D-transpeptidase [Actinomadura madurae]|uniref:L,D-transpeptidase n=1 Tax=Actinomadura madurae TaxID=1993 RepID=UPI0020275E8D|nr:Ig-like domain-containing protein [Actinomadura madurae]MCP9947933.1 Ig-like domain-containing protein [Actinomadura madurae]MCP9964706.1 Ig-like domain-containing protein [Actinomadura madurae]MCQ0011308.1 Ig-like domain-containing protein [Actinomadura madurae]MCQ0013372.1 Ig-like domain-containing protein [Actinomadura madurae]URM93594.1 Ig-like domain-containing protein [Actinomadura madurae]
MLKGRTGTAGAAIIGAVVIAAAGCSSGGDGGKGGDGGGKGGDAVKLAIAPATGTKQAAPDKPVTVTAANGKLTSVTLTYGKKKTKAEGALAQDRTSWKSAWTLRPSTTYTVTAQGTGDDGKQVTATSTFTTLTPQKKLESGMSPLDGETVGVGMPVQLLLSRPVSTKAGKVAVEKALEVRMSKPVEGAWYWVSDKEVDFRPRDYWPSGQKVEVVAHLAGLKAGEGMYGMKDRSVGFTVGPRHVTTIDAKKHRATVTDGGKTVRTMRVSLGKPGHDSYSGTMIAQEKASKIIMDSATTGNPGEYRIPTKWNVRLTYSGTFVHSAPWSTDSQGNDNVSHGCVNASPSDAKWFYDFTNRGDIVKVTGTSRQLRFGNGPTPWAKDWDGWLAGSATGKPVMGVPLK